MPNAFCLLYFVSNAIAFGLVVWVSSIVRSACDLMLKNEVSSCVSPDNVNDGLYSLGMRFLKAMYVCEKRPRC